MNENDVKKPNYKIWMFGKSKYDKVTIEKFYAENDDVAYEHLKDFKKLRPVLDDNHYYYGTIHYVCTVDCDGNRSEECDIDDRESRMKMLKSKKPWFKKIKDEMSFLLHYYFIDKPRDIKYWFRDLIYLLKNKEAYSNQWNLDWHILDSIERNVPSLIENSYALAFINEAIIKMHGNDPGFDLDKYYKEHCMGYPEDVEEFAMKIQKEEYSNLLRYVKCYKYYSSFGDIDFDNPEEVALDKELRHTLPIKKGTYDEISDYKKAMSLSKEYWNKIWDWMKAYGDKLND